MLYGGDVTIAATDFGCNVLKPAMQSIWITFGTRSISTGALYNSNAAFVRFLFSCFLYTLMALAVISCLSLLTILSCIACGSSAISAAALTETVPARAASLRLSDPFFKTVSVFDMVSCDVLAIFASTSRVSIGFKLSAEFCWMSVLVPWFSFAFAAINDFSFSANSDRAKLDKLRRPNWFMTIQISASMRSLTPSMMSRLRSIFAG